MSRKRYSAEEIVNKLRDELLARERFDTLKEARVLIARWWRRSNTLRPHSSLGCRPPGPGSNRIGAVLR